MTVLHQPGTLIKARERQWVVLPDSTADLLMVRPLGGLDEEITGILPSIEPVTSDEVELPKADDLGDSTGCRLLLDAARLSTRAAAGPFRSFARIAVEPRPYQLVPLMMALQQDPVRLLIADDVGIGKTVEACLIARELLDRNEIRSMAVLCPPQLAEQWQRALREQFHIEAELVLSSTIRKLERPLRIGESVFDRHPFTIVSLDYIKSQAHADDFVRNCPDLVLVDEAHSCTLAGGVGRGHQQRYALLKKIAEREGQNLLLITATPHNGNENAFRSLLSLLDPEFANLPVDISREEREGVIRKLAKHLVQRRRGDLVDFDHDLKSDTTFPTRVEPKDPPTYRFTPAYKELFNDIVEFAREYVGEEGEGDKRRQRVRYWSALALLRCVSSSPAAAIATLRSRAAVDSATPEEVDEVGRRTVMDQSDEDEASTLDLNPGSQNDEEAASHRQQMLAFAERAEQLMGEEDAKLKGAVKLVKDLMREGYQPIVFCRFVETAEYVARELRTKLRGVHVESVTGTLPPADREKRIGELVAKEGTHVLVCTDCLSEGVNLQEHFNAVVHYDLAWTPTRHEQREGRVDRYGQRSPEVRVLTYFGKDNPIDGVIWQVLIRKHKQIKSDLRVTVSLPTSSEEVAQALFEGALFKRKARGAEGGPTLFDEEAMNAMVHDVHNNWTAAGEQEKKSRSRFAQHWIKKEAVARELEAVRSSIGSAEDVERFVRYTLQLAGLGMQDRDKSLHIHVDAGTRRSLRQALGTDKPFSGRFQLPLGEHDIYLGRTSPKVEGLASWVLDQALDTEARDDRSPAARCGFMFTSAVRERTTLVLARFRYHLKDGRDHATLLCEEIVPLAFTGMPENPAWLDEASADALMAATPAQNMSDTAVQQQLQRLIQLLPAMRKALEPIAAQRGELQREAHRRVREAVKEKAKMTVEPVLPVDILGAYVYLAPLGR
jgi:superfamily II DNA or RNA helicase